MQGSTEYIFDKITKIDFFPMSVDNYTFMCPQCGHIEKQREGIYLFSDKCHTMLQCPKCKKVRTIQLSESETIASDYPYCHECNIKMVKWDKTCPECCTAMKVERWTTDTI